MSTRRPMRRAVAALGLVAAVVLGIAAPASASPTYVQYYVTPAFVAHL